MALPSSSIQVSCQQTRFHIAEGAENREVGTRGLPFRPITDRKRQIDVHDLSISLVSRESPSTPATSSSKAKSAKSRPAGLEILNGAHLRIKSGGRYGFIGKNGSGKSSVLSLGLASASSY